MTTSCTWSAPVSGTSGSVDSRGGGSAVPPLLRGHEDEGLIHRQGRITEGRRWLFEPGFPAGRRRRKGPSPDASSLPPVCSRPSRSRPRRPCAGPGTRGAANFEGVAGRTGVPAAHDHVARGKPKWRQWIHQLERLSGPCFGPGVIPPGPPPGPPWRAIAAPGKKDAAV